MSETNTRDHMRIEYDSLGPIEVPADRPWGAVTERSRRHFQVGSERMPTAIIHALAWIKEAAAHSNASFGLIEARQAEAIAAVCGEIRSGALDEAFPLPVWQTGSGTQTNMNLNEVISYLGNRRLPEGPALHPNDTVNRSQSSNDVFPAALHMAAVLGVRHRLLPALEALAAAIEALAARHPAQLKLGRTHLMDATPLRFEQECEAWAAMLRDDAEQIAGLLEACLVLPLGGTAVGTGLNSPEGFAARCCALLAEATGEAFRPAPVPARHIASKSALTALHGGLAALAGDLHKLASDIRLLGSGPRAGLGELRLPAGEPGSSIMPGKVNPTQCEMLTMVAIEVLANDQAIAMANALGQLQLNVYMPLIGYEMEQSIALLSDAMRSFTEHCVAGIEVDAARMDADVEHALMRVTALSAEIGYRRAAELAQQALASGRSLREEVLAAGLMDEARYDELSDPLAMTRPDPAPEQRTP